MKELIKQPNGKYCFYNSRDGWTINLTEDDIVAEHIRQAKKEAQASLQASLPSAKLIEKMVQGYVEQLTDDALASMGFRKSYEELVIYVPRKPLDKSYVSCDFATHGKCPTCGCSVQDGMGHTDEKCPRCGQVLEWRKERL